MQIELACSVGRRESQDVRVCRIRERNACQIVHPHSRGHRKRRRLHDIDGSLTHDVTGQDLAGLAVGDQLAEDVVLITLCYLSQLEDLSRTKHLI